MEHRAFVALLIVTIAVTGTANNFASQIKAKILGDANFICVVPDSIVQSLLNGVLCFIMVRRKKVTASQFRYLFRCGKTWAAVGGWKLLALAGVSDIMNNVTGLMAQPYITTFMMSLMNQAITPFTVFFSVLLLRTRYIILEIAAVIIIVCCAVACVYVAGGSNDQNDSEFWAAFTAATTSFGAFSFVLKEVTFNGYKAFSKADCGLQQALPDQCLIQLQQPSSGQQPTETLPDSAHSQHGAEPAGTTAPELDTLNVFLVGTLINVIGLLSCVPIAILNYSAVNSGSAWEALVDGFGVLVTKEHALSAYCVYIVINTAYNIALILTTSHASALLSFLSLKMAVPLTAIFSAVPWPVIGSKPLVPAEWIILVLLVAGIVTFRVGNVTRIERESRSSTARPG